MSEDDKNFFDLQRLKMIDEECNRRIKSLFQSTEEERQDVEEDDVPTIFKMAKERITKLVQQRRSSTDDSKHTTKNTKRRKTTATDADEYDNSEALNDDEEDSDEEERFVLDDVRY